MALTQGQSDGLVEDITKALAAFDRAVDGTTTTSEVYALARRRLGQALVGLPADYRSASAKTEESS